MTKNENQEKFEKNKRSFDMIQNMIEDLIDDN